LLAQSGRLDIPHRTVRRILELGHGHQQAMTS